MVRRCGKGISCACGQPVLGEIHCDSGPGGIPSLQPPLGHPFSSNLNTGRPEEQPRGVGVCDVSMVARDKTRNK